jgi:glucose dehydrogenase
MGKYRNWIWVLIILVIGLAAYLMWPLSPVAKEITQYSKDWPLPNYDYSNTRATTSSTINSSNAANLHVQWSFPIPGIGQWGAASSNPIIQGQTVYLQDLKSNVFALDLASGQLKWKKEYDLDAYGPNGPVVARDRVYVAKGHYEMAALDMNGKELWSTKLSDIPTTGIDMQPLEYDGLVYVSTVPGTENANYYTGGGMGIIYGLDYKTGKIKWTFNTVEEGALWGNQQVNSGGGAWYPPAIDTKSGLMFWGTGNPAPWPGTADFPNGSSRPGANLYTNSLLALKHDSGVLSWYQQVLPHDLFDLDLQISPVLATVDTEQGTRDIVIASGKMGRIYAFERASGKQLWTVAVGQHQNDTLTELPAGLTQVLPGPLGGVETPMAYKDGILYAPVLNLPGSYTPTNFDGSSFNIGAGKGELVAVDARDGNILWSQSFESLPVGAATVVNDLVFTSTFDGKIYAFDRQTGAKVWEYQASGGINGWPAVTGSMIIFPVGLGPNPVLLSFSI